MNDSPTIAAIVIAYARADALAACLASLASQTEREHAVIVVLNGATAEVEAAANAAASSDARVRPVTCARSSASAARNLGVTHTSAAALYFLDDDVCLPQAAFETALGLLRAQPEVSIAGGPNLTPPDDPAFAQITGALLASPWGTGMTHTRYASRHEGPASERDLILCNLLVRRAVFERGLSFPTLFGGEENALMGHARASGMAFWYSPKLWAYHARRKTLRGYLEQIYRYGWGRAIAMLSAPHTAHPQYFVPLVFTLYLLALPFVSSWSWAIVPLLVYLGGTFVAAVLAAWRARRVGFVLPLMLLFPLTHVVYAAGLAQLLVRLLPGRLKASASPRSGT